MKTLLVLLVYMALVLPYAWLLFVLKSKSYMRIYMQRLGWTTDDMNAHWDRKSGL